MTDNRSPMCRINASQPMHRRFFTCVVVLLFVSPFASGRQRPPLYQDPEGYLLLSTVLDNEAAVQHLKEVEINERSNVSLPLALCRQIPEEFRAAAEDLTTQSKTEVRFAKKFSLSPRWVLRRLLGEGFQISVVGFDRSRTHAVLAVFKGCGSMCSGGLTYLFRKANGEWRKVGEVCETMS